MVDFSQPLNHFPALSLFIDPEPLEGRRGWIPTRELSAILPKYYIVVSVLYLSFLQEILNPKED